MRLPGRGATRLSLALAVLAVASAVTAAASSAPVLQGGAGHEALLTGRYEEAIDWFEARVRQAEATPADYRALVEALQMVGRYDEAVGVAEAHGADHAGSAELANSLGQVLFRLGRWDQAEAAFRRAVDGRAEDWMRAELNLAILEFRRGEREAALRGFDRFIDYYNDGSATSATELTAVAVACTYLAIRDWVLSRDALKAFDEAVAADPGATEPRILLGELFLSKYDSTQADGELRAVLEVNPNHPDALVAMARRMDFDGSPEAVDLLDKALEINPSHVPARTLQARFLLIREQYEAAAAEAQRALDIDPRSLEALSILAAARFLQRDEQQFEAIKQRVLEINPSYADLFNVLAELAVQNRLYHQAVEFAHTATELDAESWRGFGLLGINQLRIGDIAGGRASLEIAFEGDPYNVWNKNTLDLLDTFPDYDERSTARFQLMIEKPEAELLELYVGDLAEEAYDYFSGRYGYRPPTPIRIEVYPSHDDFSVRTVGLANLGALGVSFGPVIAVDSPSARDLGPFNWGATLWHEIAHTFTLGMTDYAIPRWLSEGISVYEERRAREGWGADASVTFLVAHLRGRLLPVSRLTDGFVRPRYPDQVVHSYYQASLVCELIERDFGFPALLEILDGYRRGGSTDEIFAQVLGMDIEEFDELFTDYLTERFAGPLAALQRTSERMARAGEAHEQMAIPAAPDPTDVQREAVEHPGDFTAQLRWGAMLFEQGRPDEAVPFLERARDLFPEYGAADSPYWFLAMIAKQRGEIDEAIDLLTSLVSVNGKHWQAHLELAELRVAAGDAEAAADALDRSLYIDPLQMETHARLAELLAEVGDHDRRVRERRAVVALDPVDRAEALYRLAVALVAAGDRAEAKRQVLAALEIAPGYPAAQELLLELVGGRERDR